MSTKDLPRTARVICHLVEAWVVGGAARDEENPKDVDILVPFSQWHIACHFIPHDARPNGFGGWKFKDEDIWVDVWPGDVALIMSNAAHTHMWCPKTGVRWVKQKQGDGSAAVIGKLPFKPAKQDGEND